MAPFMNSPKASLCSQSMSSDHLPEWQLTNPTILLKICVWYHKLCQGISPNLINSKRRRYVLKVTQAVNYCLGYHRTNSKHPLLLKNNAADQERGWGQTQFAVGRVCWIRWLWGAERQASGGWNPQRCCRREASGDNLWYPDKKDTNGVGPSYHIEIFGLVLQNKFFQPPYCHYWCQNRRDKKPQALEAETPPRSQRAIAMCACLNRSFLSPKMPL